MVVYKMRTSSRSSSRTKRKSKSKGRKGNGFSTKTLKQVVKLGVTGMVAMYVATLLVNMSAVSSVAGKIASIIGISKEAVLYAAKGTGVAAIALRLHKELDKL